MSLSRWWTETTAALGDHLPLPLAALLLLLTAGLAALGWYHHPAWVPHRLPRLRLRLPRRRRSRPPRVRRRRGTGPATAGAPVPAPDAAPADAGPLADRLAAQGRYAEAVRERLRGMLGELVARRVVEQRPGMTVAELTAAATARRPPVGPPLAAAAGIFSDLWYAQRPAAAEHDHRMRELAADLHLVLTAPAPQGGERA
ncbi:hypothetical protein C5N14_04610 [Micromonospora sp. MW-13]|uniref:DUF4129 domain-containing protein n=1 Tax=Micromonospora sp. MW-13 TaxID=2094022 RepID=UPI000EEFB441|nr:DUF4129 domain-containing protein [Micromonospora sp. MW-13]RGC69688.1 hypothetical protein C5N14_04610 [Micromonospora sp. MW-13]